MQFSALCLVLCAKLSLSLVVHKCCPSGEFLIGFDCISPEISPNSSAEEIPSDDLSWFPFSALFNHDTELPMKLFEQTEVRRWLMEPGVIHAGNFSEFHFNMLFSHADENYTNGYDFKIFASEDHLEVLINFHPEFEETHIRDPAFAIPTDELCFDVNDTGGHYLLFPSWKVFFQKCCAYGMLFDMATYECIDNVPGVENSDWLPSDQILMNDEDYDLGVPRFIGCAGFANAFSMPTDYYCRGFNRPEKRDFFANGSLLVGKNIWEPGSFCGDVTLHPEGKIVKHNLLLCYNSKESNHNTLYSYGVLFILGGFVLLVTVSISLYLPQLRQRLHNKIAITHNLILMVAHFAWGAQFFYDDNVHNDGCSIRVLIVQYTFLASLFWLNVFCINMSSTFRTTRTLSNRSRNSEQYRYFIYSLYAWGAPAAITVFTIVMEVLEQPLWGIPRPGITCFCDFAQDMYVRFIYMHGPMSMLLMSNITLYVFTTWKIISVHRQTAAVLKRQDSNKSCGGSSQNDYQKLMLYTKLFFVMGITWTMDIITSMCDIGNTTFSVICDVLNILRPMFIFVIFICKKAVFMSLKERLLRTTGHADVERSTTTDAMSLSGMASRKASQYEITAAPDELARVRELLIKHAENTPASY